jgi:exosome complex component RRP40
MSVDNAHGRQLPLVIVLPGDNVTEHISEFQGPERQQQQQQRESHSSDPSISSRSHPPSVALPKIGTGLRFDVGRNQIYATCPGRLEKRQTTYYVQQNLRRYYQPALEDRVVGIVQDRAGSDGAGGDLYRVDIGASHLATVSNLSAFEGASKRNRPGLAPGQVLYARVAALHGNGSNNSSILDPTLECRNGPHDAGVPRRDWMTNEGCYGELHGGTVCKISTGLARELLNPDNLVLNELARCKIAFEVAVGVNGMLWIHSVLPEYTVLIQNAIQNSEVLTEEQVRAMVKSVKFTVDKQLQQRMDSTMTDD